MMLIKSIQNRIYDLRGESVMLDKDLAHLYEVGLKVLNQAVKRNIKRFPSDFMFQLTREEYENLKFEIEALEGNDPLKPSSPALKSPNLRSQIVTSSWGGTRYMPYAFTEQGIAMLSGVLNSDVAISMSIAIMRAFVEIKRILLRQNDIKEQLKEIKDHLGVHDTQLNQLYDAMENLLDKKAAQRKWDNRERIGFRN